MEEQNNTLLNQILGLEAFFAAHDEIPQLLRTNKDSAIRALYALKEDITRLESITNSLIEITNGEEIGSDSSRRSELGVGF